LSQGGSGDQHIGAKELPAKEGTNTKKVVVTVAGSIGAVAGLLTAIIEKDAIWNWLTKLFK